MGSASDIHSREDPAMKKKATRKLELNRQSIRHLTNAEVGAAGGGAQTGDEGVCWVNTVRFDCYGRTGAARGCAAGSGWQDCGAVPGQ
jgi:hypothetical protein